ncbi:MAG: hypothetical protein AB8B55_11770 [Mariniblastus sp.]
MSRIEKRCFVAGHHWLDGFGEFYDQAGRDISVFAYTVCLNRMLSP